MVIGSCTVPKFSSFEGHTSFSLESFRFPVTGSIFTEPFVFLVVFFFGFVGLTSPGAKTSGGKS